MTDGPEIMMGLALVEKCKCNFPVLQTSMKWLLVQIERMIMDCIVGAVSLSLRFLARLVVWWMVGTGSGLKMHASEKLVFIRTKRKFSKMLKWKSCPYISTCSFKGNIRNNWRLLQRTQFLILLCGLTWMKVIRINRQMFQ